MLFLISGGIAGASNFTLVFICRLLGKVKVKQSRYRPGQEVEAPRFQDNRHMKVVRLSALSTGRLYPPGIIPGTHFC